MTTFYCIARLSEFTVLTIKGKFDPAMHISRTGVSTAAFTCHAPKPRQREKTLTAGAAQAGSSDPQGALENHFRINPAAPDDHLFAWIHPTGGLHPLSKAQCLKRTSMAANAVGLPNFKGHSLHIRGTLKYLL